jgi:phosphoribosylaminoimidazole-succinocarboxamide synthase
MTGKGRCNAAVSSFFFQYLENQGVKTHFIGMIDETRMVVRRLQMIPLEVIVRNYAAGSLVRNYPFKEGQKLNPSLIVLDYKDDSRHDPMINDEIIGALGIATPKELKTIKETALAINRHLSLYLAGQGIMLVDFKLEFGRAGKTIYVGDEISMDSMRLWDKKTGASLDKDVYRLNKGDVMATYNSVASRITKTKEQKKR